MPPRARRGLRCRRTWIDGIGFGDAGVAKGLARPNPGMIGMTVDQMIRRLYGPSAPPYAWFRPASFVIDVMKDRLGAPDDVRDLNGTLELTWHADDGRVVVRGVQGVMGGQPALLKCEAQVCRTKT